MARIEPPLARRVVLERLAKAIEVIADELDAVDGGPTANNQNAFTLGTPSTKIYVMHGETAAVASFSRRRAACRRHYIMM